RLALLVGRGGSPVDGRQGSRGRPLCRSRAHREGGSGGRRAVSMSSLYDELGGEAKVRAILQSLYDRLFSDPMVGFLFEGKDKGHIVEQQVAFTCRFLGGPQQYEGR